MFLILIITITFTLAAKIPEPCCSKKTVGDLSYTLVNSEDTSIASRYGCKSNCVYQQDDSPGALFCFAVGDLPTNCADAVSVTASTKLTTTTKSAITTEVVSGSYLYLSETKIVDLTSFQEISCNQQWPERKLEWAIARLVSYNNTKEVMLCGGIGRTGCHIWTENGWIQSDTSFNRFWAPASETSAGLLVTGGSDTWKPLKSSLLFTTEWEDFGEIPVATNSHCQVTVDNTVYIFGGFTDSGEIGETYKLTSSNRWSKLSSLNTKRRNHACVEWDGGILAIGGFVNGDGLSTVERYDIESNQWISFTPLLVKLYRHQAVVWGDDVYVLGGYDSTNRVYNKVVYKLKKGSQTWEVVPGVSVDLGTDKRSIFPYLITSNIHCNN